MITKSDPRSDDYHSVMYGSRCCETCNHSIDDSSPRCNSNIYCTLKNKVRPSKMICNDYKPKDSH